jgi:hypothetical protein
MAIAPRRQSWRRKFGRILSPTLALAAFGTVAAFLIPFGTQRSANAEPVIPAGVSLTSWFDNGRGGEHVLQIVRGNAPPAGVRVVGTVVTDTDCDPDANGLNHCHNRIDLADGGSIEVIHNHAMHRYPCLAPGQRMSITGLDAGWAIADRPQPSRADQLDQGE